MKAEDLPFADGEFDVATAIEVLEHVPDPEHTVAEMARCTSAATSGLGPARAALARAQHGARRVLEGARQHARPREPLVQARLHAAAGPLREVVEARSPFPWTMLLVRVVMTRSETPESATATRAVARATAVGPRILSSGSPRPGIVTFAYFSVAAHVLSDDRVRRRFAAVVGAVRHRVGDLPADRAAALAHDRRPPRTRLTSGHPLRVPLLIQGGFALVVPRRRAASLRGPIEAACSTAPSRCTGSSSAASLAYAASYFARGWLAGHQRFALYGGLVFLEAMSRVLFAVAVAWHRERRRPPSRWAWRRHRSSSLVVVPLAFARRAAGVRRPERREDDLAMRAAARFAVSCCDRCWPSRRLLNGAVLPVDADHGDARSPASSSTSLLIARAPLQLFQAVQGSLLPHLAGLEATAGRADLRGARSGTTVLAIAGVRGRRGDRAAGDRAVSDGRAVRRRPRPTAAWGLALVAVGMGLT